MKKFLLLNVLIVLLFVTSSVSAATFKKAIFFSINDVGGWKPGSFVQFVESGSTYLPTISIPGFVVDKDLPYMASIQGYFGSDDSYTDDPADANGKSVIWSEPDSTSITGNILSGSVFQLARSTNLQTIGGTGSNPIISWENTLTDIDQFRVRVFRPTFDGFLVDVSLAGGSRDFNFNDIAFDFDPGEDYIIRVDARKHRTLDNLTGFTIDQENGYWAGIINQSTSNDLAYSNPVPVPAAIWLFVSGLLGLVGLRRKQN